MDFAKDEIVPDIIDEGPLGTLEVKYGSVQLKLGDEKTPAETGKKPSVTWKADPNKFYMLVMIGMCIMDMLLFVCPRGTHICAPACMSAHTRQEQKFCTNKTKSKVLMLFVDQNAMFFLMVHCFCCKSNIMYRKWIQLY